MHRMTRKEGGRSNGRPQHGTCRLYKHYKQLMRPDPPASPAPGCSGPDFRPRPRQALMKDGDGIPRELSLVFGDGVQVQPGSWYCHDAGPIHVRFHLTKLPKCAFTVTPLNYNVVRGVARRTPKVSNNSGVPPRRAKLPGQPGEARPRPKVPTKNFFQLFFPTVMALQDIRTSDPLWFPTKQLPS